jgi:hypothetical protein
MTGHEIGLVDGSVNPASTRPARISCNRLLAVAPAAGRPGAVDAPRYLRSGNTYRRTLPPDSRSAAQLARAIRDDTDRFPNVLKDALAERTGLRPASSGTPPDPEEQRLAELLFEQHDLPADGRLRDVELPAARGERTGSAIAACRISSCRRSTGYPR